MNLTETTVDQVAAQARAAQLAKRSIKKDAKIQGCKLALSMVDLTTLEGQDSHDRVVQLCQKARQPYAADPSIPPCAAVCVYPPFIKTAKKALAGSTVQVATVATAFPSGQAPLSIKLDEVRACVEDGADEVDMVINRGAFLAGEHALVADEIAAVKEACGPAHLKVILETHELLTYDNVRAASMLAMEANADFIKTSTGKLPVGATLPVTLVMLEAIRDYYFATGRMVGMKPAGGIRTTKDALKYLVLVNETLGDAWMTPKWYRLGASSVANDLVMQLVKQATGNYQSSEYFSIA